MTTSAAMKSATPRLGAAASEMLEGLYQHRLLSTTHLHDLYTPQSARQWTQHLIRRLQHAGLVAATREPGGLKLLYLTPAGVDAVEAIPRTEPRRKLVVPEQAAGPLQQHTLAVNDVGVAFVQAARHRRDGFGPLSWRHELAHPLDPSPGRRRPDQLIADALLSYQQVDADGGIRFHYRFLELDRATMPVDALAVKLARYTRLFHHLLAPRSGESSVWWWQTRYPVFPTVLLVLANAPRRRLERRRQIVLSLCGEDPDLRRTPEVEISVCLLEDLQEQEPFAGIWRTPIEPSAPVDWLGQPVDADDGSGG